MGWRAGNLGRIGHSDRVGHVLDPGRRLRFLVKAFNREVEGLDDVEVWIHTSWGNPNMQKVFTDESYANLIEVYLERLKGDV